MPNITSRFASLCGRLAREEGGQDLLEYVFIAVFVAIVGYVVINSIGPGVSATYATWIDPTQGSPRLWDPADPWVSSGS